MFKNAIDWLTRRPADIPRVFGRRPVGLIGASPAAFGTILSQSAWLPIFRTLGMRPWFGQLLYVGGAHKVFDPAGKLIDEAIRTGCGITCVDSLNLSVVRPSHRRSKSR